MEEKILDYNKINETINLPSSTLMILSLDQNHKIENLIVNSSKTNDSALIIKLNKNNLKKIEFNQINYQNQILNEKIQNRNITGCINIVDSDFKIENVIVNGSNCEDGLNIVKSTGQIENITIKDAISDGVDFDYSSLKLILLMLIVQKVIV